MYVILVNNDNTLSAPKKERIVQRSKLFDNFWILVPQDYNEHDMSNCTVLLEYLKPISKDYKTEILVLSKEKYKDHLKYVLPIDTEFTKESGTLELTLTFIYVDIDADGNPIQRVRKTAPPLKVEIVPVSKWSDVIPDSALSAIDQRIIKTDAQIKALNDLNNIMYLTKADNLKYNEENNELQLMAGNMEIGDKVILKNNSTIDKDGVPIVDFSTTSDTDIDTDIDSDDSNVIEF